MERFSALHKYNLISPIINDEQSAVAVSLKENVPIRTIRHWVKQFSEEGLKGLERVKRKDTGKIRVMNNELFELTKALAMQKPPVTIASIHRKITILSKRQSIDSPSYETIYKIVKNINPALLKLAHEGCKVYQQKYEMIFRRDCNASNEIWQIDHTMVDIFVIDDNGKERRPWLTTVIDDYSRAIAGIFISFDTPSAINTALALRQAIWKKEGSAWEICGIPQILYTDHGSDFMSNHIEQVCANLKIRMVNSLVGKPQGRGKVERFFQTLNECVLIDLSGFSLNGKPVSKPSLSLAQLETIIIGFILEEYHTKDHSATGTPPLKKWSKDFLPQLPESLKILDLLLLTIHKPRKIQRDGIRFQGMRYIAPTLAGFVGESITIRYDPRDLAEIKIYHHDKFLCKAVCQDIAEMVVSLKDIQTARNRIRKDLYLQINKSKKLIKGMVQEKGNPKNQRQVNFPEPKLNQPTIQEPKKSSTPLKLYNNE